MSPIIKKSHSATDLIYHLVCPIKYRRKIFTKDNEPTIKEICLELQLRYELYFLEIGIDIDHIHFLIQAIPNIAPSEIANTVKGNVSLQFFKKHPEVKRFLWGGHFFTSGYFMNTVGNANMSIITNYVKKQGFKEYKQLHHAQPTLFHQ
jgi:REP element-mobilizing transposase RayT